MNHPMNGTSHKYRSRLNIGFLPILVLFALAFFMLMASPATASLSENRTGHFLSSEAGFAGVEGVLNIGLNRACSIFSYDFTPGSLDAPKRKGLTTPNKYFGSKTKTEVEAALEKKFGSPRGQGPNNKSYYDAKNKRTYNVHHDPKHRDGKPHVDIRKRDLPTNYYKDRPFFLKE